MLMKIFPTVRLIDAPNALTIFNASLGFLAIGLALNGYLRLCATTVFFAALVDYMDGYLARTFFNEHKERRELGKQLDTLADLMNFSIAPAVTILIIFPSSVFTLPICTLLVLSSVLRLAFFNVLPETKKAKYIGLPTTYSGFVLANILFLSASGDISENQILSLVFLLATAQLLNISINKLHVKTVIPLMILIFVITVIFSN